MCTIQQCEERLRIDFRGNYVELEVCRRLFYPSAFERRFSFRVHEAQRGPVTLRIELCVGPISTRLVAYEKRSFVTPPSRMNPAAGLAALREHDSRVDSGIMKACDAINSSLAMLLQAESDKLSRRRDALRKFTDDA